jgi:hypothetical protein
MPADHYRVRPGQRVWIGERVAVDEEQVGVESRTDTALAITESAGVGGLGGR